MSVAPVDFRSLKSKILLPLLLAGAVLCLLVLWGIYLVFQDSLTDKLRQRAELVANMVNYAAESISRAGELQRIITAIGADKDVLEIVVVAGNPPRVIASTEFIWLRKPLTALPKEEVADDLLKTIQTRAPHSHFNDNQHLFDFSSPLLLSHSSLAKDSLVEGAIMVHLDTRLLQAEILRSTQVFSAIFLGALTLLAILGYLLLQRFALHPIAVINNLIEEAAASHDIAWGKTDTHDEIGLLAHTLRDSMRRINMVASTLNESNERFRQIAENIKEVFWMNDAINGNMLYVSPSYEVIWGRTVDSLYASPKNWIEAIHVEDRQRVLQAAMTKQVAGLYDEEYRIVQPDGSVHWIHEQAFPVRNDNGDVYRIAGMAADVTEHKRTEEKIRHLNTDLLASEKHLQMIVDSALDAVITMNDKGLVTGWNPVAERIFGYSRADAVGKPLESLIVPPPMREAHRHGLAHFLKTGEGPVLSKRIEITAMQAGGGEFPVEMAIVAIRSGEGFFFNAFLRDITEKKDFEERLLHMAQYDALTSLPNRVFFSDRLQQVFSTSRRTREHFGIMFIDLDKFKPINDTYGHAVGDILLKEVALRMQNCLRQSDTVARIGGDEFVVLLATLKNDQDAQEVAEKIRQALNLPFQISDNTLCISSSIGVAIYPSHGDNEKELVKNADLAMYYAKENGRNNVTTYHAGMKDWRIQL